MSSGKHSRRGARSADMSLPPEERGRRRQQGPVGGTPAAQMSHAASGRASRWRRDGERRFEAAAGRGLTMDPIVLDPAAVAREPAGEEHDGYAC